LGIDKEVQKITLPLRTRGFSPMLSDSEVITLETIGEFLGQDTDCGTWRYFKTHWLEWFPNLGSRQNYAKHAANLWQVKQLIQSALAKQMGALSDQLHMADGFPVPVCHFKRAGFSAVFRGISAYGHCAAKSQTYYGFKGHLVISSQGIITGITLTPANVDERDALWEVVGNIQDLLIADKGLIGEDYQEQIRLYTAVNLRTPTRSNMSDTRGKDCNRWITSTRRLIETVIGQLADRFHIEKVRARDLWHLTNRIARKILAHTIGIMINKSQGNPPLQFECLGVG
jgi:IS5 family transposase